MMQEDATTRAARRLGQVLGGKGLVVTTAESCTGGGIAEAITRIPGSSAWLDRAFVTYAVRAKVEMLGVASETVGRFGVVSSEVVREMASGALARSAADLAVSVSGVAGPGGGTAETPVGTVWFGWAARGEEPGSAVRRFAGDRDAVRRQAVVFALECLERLAERI